MPAPKAPRRLRAAWSSSSDESLRWQAESIVSDRFRNSTEFSEQVEAVLKHLREAFQDLEEES